MLRSVIKSLQKLHVSEALIMIAVFLLLFGISAAQVPQCIYVCAPTVANATCEAVCDPPQCENVCLIPNTPCNPPRCSTQCSSVVNTTQCPLCDAVCEPPQCSGSCEIQCQPLNCAWKCSKPTTTPPCQWMCERPECEASVGFMTVPTFALLMLMMML